MSELGEPDGEGIAGDFCTADEHFQSGHFPMVVMGSPIVIKLSLKPFLSWQDDRGGIFP
jgi:hypothetical protein